MSVATSTLGRDAKVIGLVGIAHGYSHFYQMVLPPIFVILKIEFDVSFTALGLLATLMFTASGIFQLISGFLVDRVGGRSILLAGLTVCSAGTLLLAFADSFETLVATAIVIGIGLSVFHPADLSILTQKVNPKRLGRAYAVHGICGNLGWAVAPPFVAGLAALYDWRTAVAASGIAGLIYVGVMLIWGGALADDRTVESNAETVEAQSIASDIRVLASAPILLCFTYFTFMAMAIVGVQSFGALSLMELHDLQFGAATAALTTFMVSAAVGVFVGGIFADRTPRHHIIAMTGTGLSSIFMFSVATIGGSAIVVMALMMLSGFFLGLAMPSRDMIVRKVTPAGKSGRVFGFVYAGLDLGSLSMPVMLGWMLDRGDPKIVLLVVAALLLVTVPTVMQVRRHSPRLDLQPQDASN